MLARPGGWIILKQMKEACSSSGSHDSEQLSSQSLMWKYNLWLFFSVNISQETTAIEMMCFSRAISKEQGIGERKQLFCLFFSLVYLLVYTKTSCWLFECWHILCFKITPQTFHCIIELTGKSVDSEVGHILYAY